MQTKTNQNQILESGMERIEEIKSEISNSAPKKVCKAEVYEMWNDVFEGNDAEGN